MEINYAFFADYAALDAIQKVNALGIFDKILCNQFPAVHPRMYYVAKIKAHRSEYGNHRIKLVFVDQDGKPLMDAIEGEMLITAEETDSTIVMEFNGINFMNPGTFAIDVTVDNHHIGSTNLFVLALPVAH